MLFIHLNIRQLQGFSFLFLESCRTIEDLDDRTDKDKKTERERFPR